MNPFPRWQRTLAWLAVLAFYATVWQVWTGRPLLTRSVPPPDPALARLLGKSLADLARWERVRSWQGPDQASRQAAWIAAKAEYVLHSTRILAADTKPDKALCERMVSSWRLLQRAHTLSVGGAPEIPEESGARLRAYWSPIDDSLQTYSLALPEGYRPERTYPLIVSMHGHGWYGPFQGHPAAAIKGAFSLAPHGRGATDYMALGEDDVLTVLDEVCRDYPVDRERVYLRGSSMGGTGSWNLGVHFADRFAGILPIAGNSDYTAWQTHWGWNAGFPGRQDDLRRMIQEAQTPRAYAGNLLNLPTYVIHGSADTIVPVDHARRTVEVLRRQGSPVQYLEFPGVGHGGFPGDIEPEALAWLCGTAREAHPRRVRWSADLMRHGQAYWTRLEEKRQPLGLATLEATMLDGNRTTLVTGNLKALSIRRDPGLLDCRRPWFVDIDGERVIFAPGTPDEWLGLRWVSGVGWRDAATVPLPSRRKTAGLEGPIQEALQAPFVLVIGTRSPDPLKRSLWDGEARRFAADWKRRNLAPCPFVRDVDCTAELAESRNLILFGGSADNTVTAVLEPALPTGRMLSPLAAAASLGPLTGLSLEPEARGPDEGWFMVYPNPEHPHRLVVILAAAGPDAVYQIWGRFGNWFNWGVHDSRKYFDYAAFDARSAGPESLRLVGWFGTDWQVESGRFWLGQDLVRNALAPQAFPRVTKPPAEARVVDLVDLRPKAIDQMRGAVGFGRSFQGQPLPGSLGLRAPATLDYELDGTWRVLETQVALLNSPESALVPSRRDGEQVRFVIRNDRKELGAATVSWAKPEAALVVPLDGVKRLRLEAVCSGGPAWLHVGAAWVRPRLRR